MEFHSLSRKELQALCKKNKIPANMTNVAMADALAALQQVEGLDELLYPVDPDAQKFQDEKGVGTPDIHRTACRTSTRRKPVREEPESSKVSTRLQRRTRGGNDEGIDQENKDINVLVTPAVPTSQRRTPAISTRSKKETLMPEDEKNGGQEGPTHVPKTPAASSSRVRATSAYNTRKSVRLLEKNLAKMSLMDTEDTGSVKVNGISEELTNVSKQIEDLADTVKGASLQTASNELSEKTGELEVTSSEKNTGYECQSNDSNSEVKLGSEVVHDAGASVQAEPLECLEKINESEPPFEDMNSNYEAEPSDSNSKPEVSSEKCYNSDEVTEGCDESAVDLTKSIGEEVDANNEAENTKTPGAKNDAFSVGADASVEVTEEKHTKDEVSEGYDDPDVDLRKSIGEEVYADNQAGNRYSFENKNSCDTSEPEKMKSPGAKNDALSVEDDASVEVTEDKHMENENSILGNDIQNSEPVFGAENNAFEMNLASPKGAAERGSSNLCSSGEQHEILEDNIYPFMVGREKLEAKIETFEFAESKEYVEKDASSQNSVADIKVCIEPSAETAQNVTGSLDTSLVRSSNIDVNEAKAEPEAIDFQTDTEEYKEHAAAEETFDATSAFPCVPRAKVDCNPQIPDSNHQVSVVSGEFNYQNFMVSNSFEASISVVNCNTNTLVASVVIPEEVAIINHDKATDETLNHTSPINSRVTPGDVDELALSAMTVAPIYEQKTRDIPIQSTVADQLKCHVPYPAQPELKDNAVENTTVPKISNQEDNEQKIDGMKENLNNDELHKKSIRGLRKLLKNMTLDGKTNSKSNNSVKEVERKRTALQALPENLMTASKGHNDG